MKKLIIPVSYTHLATAVDFDKNGAAKNILTAWQKLNKDGYAPIVGKGGDAGLADFSAGKSAITLGSVSYTHLDVYKRQCWSRMEFLIMRH